MTATDELLRQGIAAARSRRYADARALLLRVVEADERSEQGWLWLAGVLESPHEMRVCLENVLQLNPANHQAREGLVWIDKKFGPAPGPAAPPAAPLPEPLPAAPAQAASMPGLPEVGAAPPRTHMPGLPPAAPGEPAPGMPDLPAAVVAATVAEAVQPTPPVSRREKAEQQKAERQQKAEQQKIERQQKAEQQKAERQQKAEQQKAERQQKALQQKAERQQKAEQREQARKERKQLPPEPGDPGRDSCPYCGELNKPERTYCRRCDRSLMIRGEPREQRSPWLSILSMLWMIGGILSVVGTVLLLVGVLIMLGMASSVTAELGIGGEEVKRLGMLAASFVLVLGLFAFLRIALARGLSNRARWAYWVVVVWTGLETLAAVLSSLASAAVTAAVLAQIDPTMLPPDAAESFSAAQASAAAGMGIGIIVNAVWYGAFLLLIALSWRDFYGPPQRFVSEVRGDSDLDYFNIGLALKSRGMWWMTMKQWEMAVARSPRDTEYRRALALAYAQLDQRERARETLDQGLSFEPNNPLLQQARASLDGR